MFQIEGYMINLPSQLHATQHFPGISQSHHQVTTTSMDMRDTNWQKKKKITAQEGKRRQAVAINSTQKLLHLALPPQWCVQL